MRHTEDVSLRNYQSEEVEMIKKAEVEFCDECPRIGTDDGQNVCCKHASNWESILIPYEKLKEEWSDWDSDKHIEIPDGCPLIDRTPVQGALKELPERLALPSGM